MATGTPRQLIAPPPSLQDMLAVGVIRVASDGVTLLYPDNTVVSVAGGSPYDPTAVAITGGTIAGATMTGQVNPSSNGGKALGAAGLGFSGLYMDYTNTATVGAVTINKSSGRAIVAAGQTSVVVTNSKATAAAHIFAVVAAADTTALLKNVVPAAGSFTINLNAAATADTPVSFFIVGAD